MTATHVDGVEVIADESTKAPFPAKGGSPVYWRQIRTLLLADGRTVYGCLHCDYTSPNYLSIRPHLKKHNSRRNGTGGDAVQQLLGQLSDLQAITADRDQWKARALAAERKMRQLGRALREVES